MKRDREFFMLSNKKSIFNDSDNSTDDNGLGSKQCSPLISSETISYENNPNTDELGEFFKKYSKNSIRENSTQLGVKQKGNVPENCANGVTGSSSQCFESKKEVIILDDSSSSSSSDCALFISNDCSPCTDKFGLSGFIVENNEKVCKNKVPRRKKSKLTLVERNLKKLAEDITDMQPMVHEFPQKLNNILKISIMVMVFFKGSTKKYMIDNQVPLIESLTPKIKLDYPETSDIPLHYFKYYNEDNKLLDFSKSPSYHNIKYADSIDCIIVPTEGNEEDFRTDMISVKFQDGSKYPIIIRMKPSDKFDGLFKKYTSQVNKKFKHIKFYFDGDLLSKDQSPIDIDMVEDFCIDVIFL